MWTALAIFLAITALILIIAIVFLINQQSQRSKIKETKIKGETALKGIELAIGDRLCAAFPDEERKWRWVCKPNSFVVDGGIARIEVVFSDGEQMFMDVCLSPNSYMALHVLNITELTPVNTPAVSRVPIEVSVSTVGKGPIPSHPSMGAKPHDEESLGKWYNIVLIDPLTTLIGNLNAAGELCLYIGNDGKAYTEENGSTNLVYEFGDMPDISFWDCITEKLSRAGLFAEVQEDNCLFISWA